MEHNQTYSEVLQEKLNREGKKVDVLNTAVTGYSPILEYLYLREKGLQYEPDIIILNVDMGDVQGDDYQTKLAKIDEKDKIIGVPPAKDGFLMFLYKKSKVIKLLEAPLIILDSKLKGKVKRFGSKRKLTKLSDIKKAIVSLKSGQKIDLFDIKKEKNK